MAINFPTSPNQGDIFEEGEGRFWIFNGTSWDSSVYPDGYNPVTYAGEESVTFPNGLIIKFGIATSVGDTTQTITFPVAFPTNCFVVTGNYDSAPEYGLPLSNFTATSFDTDRNDNINTSPTFSWIAIGN
tara:strand:+ start:56 stop:445 length:390 start_codon:yes stop_codon:yes gene_type:complete